MMKTINLLRIDTIVISTQHDPEVTLEANSARH